MFTNFKHNGIALVFQILSESVQCYSAVLMYMLVYCVFLNWDIFVVQGY